MKTIEIIVSPTGESRLETKGFAGKECCTASRFLKAALGKTVSDRPTAAFHEVQTEQTNHLEQET